MLIVQGSITINEAELDAAIALSKQHVSRSRREQGCISHAVYRSVEQSNQLVFFEQWVDSDALNAHFAQAASRQFMRDITALASGQPTLDIFNASAVSTS